MGALRAGGGVAVVMMHMAALLGVASPQSCEAGQFLHTGAQMTQMCVACPVGKFQNVSGSTPITCMDQPVRVCTRGQYLTTPLLDNEWTCEACKRVESGGESYIKTVPKWHTSNEAAACRNVAGTDAEDNEKLYIGLSLFEFLLCAAVVILFLLALNFGCCLFCRKKRTAIPLPIAQGMVNTSDLLSLSFFQGVNTMQYVWEWFPDLIKLFNFILFYYLISCARDPTGDHTGARHQ